MSEITLYLDENVELVVSEQLAAGGLDVVTNPPSVICQGIKPGE